MEDARREMLDMDELPYRIAMFEHMDMKIKDMAQRTANQCNEHFKVVMESVERGQIQQLNAIQTNTALTQRSALGNEANAAAITALTTAFIEHKESLAIISGIESTGKKGFGIIKYIGDMLGSFGVYGKKLIVGVVIMFFMYSVLTGNITVTDIFKFILKLLGD